MSNVNTISEIKSFLEGYNSRIKYLTNVETDPDKNYAECIIHEPNQEPVITRIPYIPFMHMKDLEANGIKLYSKHGIAGIYDEKCRNYGITITKLKTGNQKRLNDGFCYKIESSKSYNAIIEFLRDGGIDVYEKEKDKKTGQFKKDFQGRYVYPNREIFSSVRTTEQFFISTKSRLYKGIEEYKHVHRLTFDIETSGLRYNISRVFAIGVRDNRGLDIILEAEKLEDDESERKLIQRFFELVIKIKPAIIVGQNSETFDFDYILGRAKILGLDIYKLQTSLKKEISIKRRPNVSVKYGSTSDKFTATEIWGISIIDTLHAIKRTAAVNSEIKRNDLKYIAKYEKIARPNRTYIKGEGNDIFYFFQRNNIFVCDDKNNYLEIPAKHQEIASKLFNIQLNKKIGRISESDYIVARNKFFEDDKELVDWLRSEALPKGMTQFINGKSLTRQYLSDDLWETAEVDELYNQSSFMLSKIVPTTFQRICTMGTASVWNLLLTAWSYENDVAIPYCEKKEDFSGGMARTFKTGFAKRWSKIDYASLYPMIQLTYDIFPMFDITGVIKKMLLYLTTTRNIYKKLASSDDLNENELTLLQSIDHDTYEKYTNGTITPEDRAMFKVKQLPIKILNNSLFGALGSGIAFNWSDNLCAARITCTGRLFFRYAVDWFSKYNCIPLLGVTDGINFQIPEKSNIRILDDLTIVENEEIDIEEMWKYHGKTGIAALIDKYNDEMKADGEAKLGSKSYMSVDNDGDFISCLNLSRINYATLSYVKNKKTGEKEEKIKLTGNTIKSKTMPEYIEEFIDKGLNMILHGDGVGFVDYYNSYVEDIYYMQIPLKKIATKMRYKNTIKTYQSRGLNKNGKPKGKQAHMELLIDKRNKTALELFEKYKDGLLYTKSEDKLSVEDKIKLVIDYLPPEPEIDSMIYLVNIGTKKGDGNSGKNTETDEFNSTIITNQELLENPNLKGKYNVARYLDAFNKRVSVLTAGFDPEVAKKIISKTIVDKKTKRMELVKYMTVPSELELKAFDFNSVDDAMFLEPKEVIFWNKTGYNPYLIWDGFKCTDEDQLYLDAYDDTLSYLNEKMISVGRKPIKSINEKYIAGDFVLIKNNFDFMLGEYDGIYMKIVKHIEGLPKTRHQLDLEEKQRLRDAEIEKLKTIETDIPYISPEMELKIKYYPAFKKVFKKQFDEFGEITLEQILEMPDALEVFEDFINENESESDEYDEDEVDY